MKPTKEQIEVIQAICETIDDFQYTNDINSPSHFSNIDDWWLNIIKITPELEGKLEQFDKNSAFSSLKEVIANQITELLYSIRKIK